MHGDVSWGAGKGAGAAAQRSRSGRNHNVVGEVTTPPPLCLGFPPCRLLGRDKFKAMQDQYCGVLIVALYFMYLMVVKSALSVFDCSKVGVVRMGVCACSGRAVCELGLPRCASCRVPSPR